MPAPRKIKKWMRRAEQSAARAEAAAARAEHAARQTSGSGQEATLPVPHPADSTRPAIYATPRPTE